MAEAREHKTDIRDDDELEAKSSSVDTRGDQIEAMSASVTTILKSIGEDPKREGLLDTPKRYAKAMMFFTKGYTENLEEVCYAIFYETALHEAPFDSRIHEPCFWFWRTHERQVGGFHENLFFVIFCKMEVTSGELLKDYGPQTPIRPKGPYTFL